MVYRCYGVLFVVVNGIWNLLEAVPDHCFLLLYSSKLLFHIIHTDVSVTKYQTDCAVFFLFFFSFFLWGWGEGVGVFILCFLRFIFPELYYFSSAVKCRVTHNSSFIVQIVYFLFIGITEFI